MDQATKGGVALEAGHPLEAVAAYTKALIEHPTSPDYHIQRSAAFTRLSPPRHDLALQDADKGVLYGHQRSKRASIQAAQHRRVVSLYNLGRYADAKHILEVMQPWVGKEDKKAQMQIDMWKSKVNNKQKTLPEEQAVTVEEKPKIELPSVPEMIKLLKRQIKPDGSYNFDWESEEVPAAPAATVNDSATSQPTASTSSTSTAPSAATGKIRHEWYQNAQSVIVTLYAKGVSKEQAEVDIQDDSVSLTLTQNLPALTLYSSQSPSHTPPTQPPNSPSPSIPSSPSSIPPPVLTRSSPPKSKSPSRKPPKDKSGPPWKAPNRSRNPLMAPTLQPKQQSCRRSSPLQQQPPLTLLPPNLAPRIGTSSPMT